MNTTNGADLMFRKCMIAEMLSMITGAKGDNKDKKEMNS
jgi:hypothetical protein